MWLLFYVIDSLSVKLLQESKQAVQRQPFLHNANLPTSIPTDHRPSGSHREFENIYNKMPQSPTSIPTDHRPSVSHKEFENIYAKCHQHRRNYRRLHRQLYRRNKIRRHHTVSSKNMPPPSTGLPTDYSPSASHSKLENIPPPSTRLPTE